MVFRPITAAATASSVSAMLDTTASVALWIFCSIWFKADFIPDDHSRKPKSVVREYSFDRQYKVLYNSPSLLLIAN